MKKDQEISELLSKVEEAMMVTNRPITGESTPDSPSGWGFGQLGDAEQLSGLAAGLRYALGMPDELADSLSEKGAVRWIQDRRAKRATVLEALSEKLRQFRSRLGDQNG